MTDREVEEIIRSNLNLQMNLAGIRGDFEAKLQRTWVGLTEAQCGVLWKTNMTPFEYYQAIEAKLREKNFD